jgi:uncharacterized protein (DUF302 family)
MHAYGLTKTVNRSYPETLSRIVDELKKEGFGVLTEIDVRETLKKKLGVEFHSYKILGACNPHLAYQALQKEPDIGLLMPCNVIVYEAPDGKTVVSIVNPEVSMGRVQNEGLASLAEEALGKLKRVLEAV